MHRDARRGVNAAVKRCVGEHGSHLGAAIVKVRIPIVKERIAMYLFFCNGEEASLTGARGLRRGIYLGDSPPIVEPPPFDTPGPPRPWDSC